MLESDQVTTAGEMRQDREAPVLAEDTDVPEGASSFFGKARGGRDGAYRRRPALDPRVVFRGVSRSALLLLIAAIQLAGIQGLSSPFQGSSTAAYSCCCSGECHCTADCCNHRPDPGSDQASAVRLGAGAPAWQGSRQCGGWAGILQRAPGGAKLLFADSRKALLATPSRSLLQPSSLAVVTSTAGCLRASSPRAPPIT